MVCEASSRCIDVAQAFVPEGGVRPDVVPRRRSILIGLPFTAITAIVPPGVPEEKRRAGVFLPDPPAEQAGCR